MSSTLYAWVNPLPSIIGFLDHTWVTDYPFINGQYPSIDKIPDGSKYWYFWGIYHSSGEGGKNHTPNGAIGSQSGDLKIASSLVKSNVAPPKFPGGPGSQDGSIIYYGIDGVCHMVSNQALFATGTDLVEPLRVTDANGYSLSSFFFTDYGLNTVDWDALVQKYAPSIRQPLDYFSEWLLSMEFSAKDVAEIVIVRVLAQESLMTLRTKVPNMSNTEIYLAIAAILLVALDSIKQVIGIDSFLKLFPSFKSFPATASDAAFWIDQDQLSDSVARNSRRKG